MLINSTCTVQATQQNANAQQAKVAAANSSTTESGDASTTLPDGTPATQFTVKPTGTDRRTVTQVRPQPLICTHALFVAPSTPPSEWTMHCTANDYFSTFITCTQRITLGFCRAVCPCSRQARLALEGWPCNPPPEAQVNTEAPTYQTPTGVSFRPQLATGSTQQGAGNPGKTGLGSKSKARLSMCSAVAATRMQYRAPRLVLFLSILELGRSLQLRLSVIVGPLHCNCIHMCGQVMEVADVQALASTDIISTKTLDNEVISGDNIGQIVGVKIATPFFGTGFNFCIGEREESVYMPAELVSSSTAGLYAGAFQAVEVMVA